MSYRPSRGVRVLAVCASLIAFGLCAWQIRRDGERNEGREAALLVEGAPVLGDLDAPAPWRRVAWTGSWDEAALMAGRPVEGARGYGLLQVFTRADGRRILVDRGGLPADGVRLPAPGAGRLEGQIRPAKSGESAAVEGHGTRIWPHGAWAAAAAALGAEASFFVVSGAADGAPTGGPGYDGFELVPARDDTSLHYASQWFAIALIGLLLAFPESLFYLRRKADASRMSIG